MPLHRRLAAWWHDRISAFSRSRIAASTSLPQLLGALGNHYEAQARTRGIVLELEIDPVLAGDLHGPFAALGHALSLLLDDAFDAPTPHVALHVDVVGDDRGMQIVHFTVATGGLACQDEVAAIVASFGGVMHRERDADIGSRVIVELVLERPRPPPRIDVGALRSTLGGEQALREVIAALDRSLSSDLAGLRALLAEPGEDHLQTWLHRVSGALGMAEATELSCVGLALERDLAQGRNHLLDLAIGRFADDAGKVLEALREQAGPIGYSSRP